MVCMRTGAENRIAAKPPRSEGSRVHHCNRTILRQGRSEVKLQVIITQKASAARRAGTSGVQDYEILGVVEGEGGERLRLRLGGR